MAEHGAREWCVSLEMAQRPELAAAMQAAGMGSSWLDWELAPDDEGWQIAAVRAAVQDEITKIAIQSFRGYGLDQLHARLCLDLQHLQEHEAAEAKFAEISDYAASFSETDFNPIPVRARYRYCVADGEVRQLRRHTERLYVLYCKGASDAKN